VEVIDEAQEDGPVGFRSDSDSDGFSVWAGDGRVAAVSVRPDRFAFAINVDGVTVGRRAATPMPRPAGPPAPKPWRPG
jgi:hypothetical protein